MSMLLSINKETPLASLNTNTSWVKNVFFDADGLDFARDNCANLMTFSVKEVFNNLREIGLPPEIDVTDE